MTPREWKPDQEMILKYDDLYVRAWECEDQTPFFDTENDNPTPPNSPEFAAQSDLSTEEAWSTPETARECSREVFPQKEDLCNVTDTYPYMELDAETTSEQPNKSPTNSRSSKYSLRHNAKPDFNDDYR